MIGCDQNHLGPLQAINVGDDLTHAGAELRGQVHDRVPVAALARLLQLFADIFPNPPGQSAEMIQKPGANGRRYSLRRINHATFAITSLANQSSCSSITDSGVPMLD